jgi:uncharacterized protein (TIGR03083 family)
MSAEGRLAALRSSVTRLHVLAGDLDDDELAMQAYPTEWTVADVLSHLGSGAIILGQRLDDALAGRSTPPDFAPSVWDTWNAKIPRAQADDALASDRALLEHLESLTPAEWVSLQVPFGPFEFGFGQFVGTRLNEHAMHTWDVEVVFEPAASVPEVVAEEVIDNLDLVARFTAQPTGATGLTTVHTTAPERGFEIRLGAEAVEMSAAQSLESVDLDMASEAFARLVYGRLDPAHTPPVSGDLAMLDELRHVFPGP